MITQTINGNEMQDPISEILFVRRFFEEMSRKRNVDLNALNVHITNGQIYVQKYTPGHIDMFKLLEII